MARAEKVNGYEIESFTDVVNRAGRIVGNAGLSATELAGTGARIERRRAQRRLRRHDDYRQ